MPHAFFPPQVPERQTKLFLQYHGVKMLSLGRQRRGSTLLAVLVLSFGASSVTAAAQMALPPYIEATCADFGETRSNGTSWTHGDCTEVWRGFILSSFGGSYKYLIPKRSWNEAANELRRVGSPCLLAASPPHDGIGSSTMRVLFSWILAEEMKCDWVTPNWGKKSVNGGAGEVTYCHPIVPSNVWKQLTGDERKTIQHCMVVNLLEYFNFGVVSIDLPHNVTLKHIEVSQSRRCIDRSINTSSAQCRVGWASQRFQRLTGQGV